MTENTSEEYGTRKHRVMETKAVRVHEPDKGRYVYLLLTRFDGEDGLLGEAGWGGEYVNAQVLSDNEEACVGGANPWGMARQHPAEWFDESNTAELLKHIDMSNIGWDQISDGVHISESDLEELKP